MSILSESMHVAAAAGRRFIPPKYFVACKPRVERMLGIDELEISVIERLPFAGTRRAIDVGANWGSYAVALARLFTDVEAFEPVSKCSTALRAYAKAFARNITVHETLMSDRAGSLGFIEPEMFGKIGDYSGFAHVAGPHERSTNVLRTVTLDSYEFNDVDFIKIDVEGHERSVIEGATATIRRSHPILLVEIEKRHIDESIRDRVAFIEALGYETFFVRNRKFVAFSSFDASCDQLQSTIENDRRRYINNFFFFPRSSVARYVPS